MRSNTPLRWTFLTAFLLLLAPVAGAQDATPQDQRPLRHFLFIGEPNAAAWKFLIENPQDREKAMADSIKALGGEIITYFWGLGDGRNYITIALPDDPELIQATYVTRLGDGLLISYEAIELMTSEAMTRALTRVEEVKAVDVR